MQHRHGIGGRGGLKTDRKEDHLLIGIGLRQLDRIQRRVDYAHVPTPRADREQVTTGAGDAQHVAVGGEDDLGAGSDGEGAVDLLKRSHAHRAAGTMDEFNLLREHVVQPVMQEGMCLPAADFHQHPGSGDRGRNLSQQGF